MNKALTLLALAGLSAAQNTETADNELFKIGEAIQWGLRNQDAIRDGIRIIRGKADEDLELIATEDLELFATEQAADEELFKLGEAIQWGLRNQDAIRDGIRIIRGKADEDLELIATEDLELFSTEQAADEELFKIGEAIQWGLRNQDAIRDGIRIIRGKADEDLELIATEDSELLYIPRVPIPTIPRHIFRADDNSEDAELIYRPTLQIPPFIRPLPIAPVFRIADDELALKDKIKTGIRKGAEFVANNPQVVTKVAKFIANRIDDELIAFGGEDVLISF